MDHEIGRIGVAVAIVVAGAMLLDGAHWVPDAMAQQRSPAVERPARNLRQIDKPELQKAPDAPDVSLHPDILKKLLQSMSDCIPGFDGEEHPTDGHKYICRSAAVTGVGGCNQPFTAMTNFTPQFAQGVFVYKCHASPVASPPAQGVCHPQGFGPTMQSQSGNSVIYQCKSAPPSCGGSWAYNGVVAFSGVKFTYECQY